MMNHLTNVKPFEDPTAGVSVTGPGIIGDKARKKTNFVIRGDIPDWAPLDVNITAPDGDKVSFEEMQYAANSTAIHYTPLISGKYTIEVLVNRHHIKGSPFTAHHAEPSTALGCVCKGRGVMKAVVGEKGHFTIDCSNGGTGRLQIGIRGPTSNISTEISQISDKVYEVNYTPTEAGPHKITALWGRNHIDKSPFTVYVIDPKKCVAHGTGLTEAIVNEPASFRVETKNAGQGNLIVKVTGQNSNSIPVTTHKGSQDDYTCSYIPPKEGLYSIEILWDDQPITSAYKVVATAHVDALTIPTHEPLDQVLISDFEASNAAKCIITGLENLSVSPMIDIPLEFGVDATNGGNGELHVTTDHPSGKDSSIVTVKEIEGQKGIYRITFIPTTTGEHIVDLLWGEEYIPGSPLVFNVVSSSAITGEHLYPYGEPIEVSPECNAAKCVITGLENLSVSPMIDIPLEFGVDTTNGGNGELHVTTDHPSGKDSSIVSVKEIEGQKGIYRITFIPTTTGEHIVDLLWGEEYIPGSPLVFNVVSSSAITGEHLYPYGKPIEVSPECKATKCIITGLENLSVSPMIDIPLEFGVDATNGGNGELHVTTDQSYSSAMTIDEIKGQKGVYRIVYVPKAPGEHIVNLQWGKECIPSSPLVFSVVSNSAITGESVYPYGTPVVLQLSAECKTKDLDVYAIHKRTNTYTKLKVSKARKDHFILSFKPKKSGFYDTHVKLKGQYVAGSPYRVRYADPPDASKVTVSIVPSDIAYVHNPIKFTINVKQAGIGNLFIKANVRKLPKGKRSSPEFKLVDNEDGTFSAQFVPIYDLVHNFDVLFAGVPVPGSPFSVQVIEKPLDTPKCNVRAYGSGLEDGYVGQDGNFIIETDKAGTGVLNVRVHGPKGSFKIDMRRHPKNDHKIFVRYDPKYAGEYIIEVTWSDIHITGSPFTVNIR